MHQNNLRELFIENIRDLYDAEKRLTKALPKMAKAANSEELADAIRHHLEETQQHVERLEQVFQMIETPARAKTCNGMKGLIEEGSEAIEGHSGEDEVLSDLALIAAAQKVEHYELSGYGTVRTIAEKLGEEDAARLLQQTEDEEAKADATLNQIAMTLYESVGESTEEEEVEMAGVSSRSGGNGRGKSSGKRTRR
jgi:ferritin-like metal-binding protein YciE